MHNPLGGRPGITNGYPSDDRRDAVLDSIWPRLSWERNCGHIVSASGVERIEAARLTTANGVASGLIAALGAAFVNAHILSFPLSLWHFESTSGEGGKKKILAPA